MYKIITLEYILSTTKYFIFKIRWT